LTVALVEGNLSINSTASMAEEKWKELDSIIDDEWLSENGTDINAKDKQ
jgi:hypothetical protein